MANHVCNDCSAEFNVDFEEPSSYESEEVNYCPSCGAPIDPKEVTEADEDEEDDEVFEPTDFDNDDDEDDD